MTSTIPLQAGVGSIRASNVISMKPRGEETPTPSDPLGVARILASAFWTDKRTGLPTLRRWRDGWWLWSASRGCWEELSEELMRTQIYRVLSGMDSPRGACVYWTGQPPVQVVWTPRPTDVTQIADALCAVVELNPATEPGGWLDGREPRGSGLEGVAVACRGTYVRYDSSYSGDSGEQWRPADATPAWFNLASLAVPYDPEAPTPVEWLTFLDEIFQGDQEAIDLKQEWAGYLLSGRTNLHTAMQLLGPTRSGKGVTMRVLGALYGAGGVATTSLSSLFGSFGLQGALSAPLLVIQDAKQGRGNGGADAVERLLGIIGGDPVTVNRKFKPELHGVTLPCRVMIVGNDVLALPDNAGALSARFVFLKTKVSFLGREDRFLEDRLTTERSLQGILNWALVGLERLERNGWRFTVQRDAQVLAEQFAAMGNPLSEFAEDCLVEIAGGLVEFDSVYCLHKGWCLGQGYPVLPKVKLRANLNGWRSGMVTRSRADGRPYMVNGYVVSPKISFSDDRDQDRDQS